MKRVRAAFTVASQQEKCVLFICSRQVSPSHHLLKKKCVWEFKYYSCGCEKGVQCNLASVKS